VGLISTCLREVDQGQIFGGDPGARVDLDDPGAPHQELERQRLRASAGVEEMAQRVDMGPGVGAHAGSKH
jgi:hypothetical protein